MDLATLTELLREARQHHGTKGDKAGFHAYGKPQAEVLAAQD